MAADGDSLAERFQRAVAAIESDPGAAIDTLQDIQQQVARLSLWSDNEELTDISTGSLPFLLLEHYLAMALIAIPTGPSAMIKRKSNLDRACGLWGAFLQQLDRLELLCKDEQQQYQDLIAVEEQDLSKPPPSASRDTKIARFRAKQAAEQERQRLESLQARRHRLGIEAENEMDGFDEESLQRSLALTSIQICKAEALDEWSSAIRELPMIAMMVQAEQERQGQERYNGQRPHDQRSPPPQPSKPLQLTHITQSADGQLHIRRDEVKSGVFRPGWNQPTMSLEEYAERELAQAMEREERQKLSESQQEQQARRYADLQKQGLEDNVDLVDQSAKLDRDWDDWKDENPRGSGNKRGDVGDRNF